MINDPLTLELSETLETAFLYQYEHAGLGFHAYGFNGSNDIDGEDRFQNWGMGIEYSGERSARAWGAQIDYISNMVDSDTLGDIGFALQDQIGAISAAAYLFAGAYGITIEYLGAEESFPVSQADFNGRGADPAVLHLELTRGVHIEGRSVTLGLAYQTTEDLLFAELPERRLSAVVTGEVADGIALSLELFRDEDYPITDTALGTTGTGEDSTGLVFQLATEF